MNSKKIALLIFLLDLCSNILAAYARFLWIIDDDEFWYNLFYRDSACTVFCIDFIKNQTISQSSLDEFFRYNNIGFASLVFVEGYVYVDN